ncbi:MAG: tripartite tricarboxylate transporter permease [Rhodobacteraceae bacterium]|nr:tripartite tricarboxylate transporter permease [Paracoccaceae bacterium]
MVLGGITASFWIGNIFLLILNIPLIGLWVRLLTVPYHLLYPAMLFFIVIGVYSVHNSSFDVLMTLGFGLVGFTMMKFDFPAAPLLLGFVLGPLVEERFRRALILARSDITVFVDRPVSLGFLLATLVVLLATIGPVRKIILRLLRRRSVTTNINE